MTLKIQIEEYLDEQPLFRERKNKDRGMVNLLMRKYGGLERAIKEGLLTKESITAIVQDYASMDRVWRKALEENVKWRGTDYDEKDHLEALKMVELGYRAPVNIGQREAVEKAVQPTLL